jgi:cytochrome c oxidase assembly protein subunit 11
MTRQASEPPTPRNHFRVVGGLTALVVGMFGFGFLMVPLYEKFCEITGFNGFVSSEAASMPETPLAVDPDRRVRVEFVSTVNDRRPWAFRAQQSSLEVMPGELYTAYFVVDNLQGHSATTQIIPSVTPGGASRHLRKTECFCFTAQHFEAGEQRVMPVTFFVDPELSERTGTLTLSYTLFDISAGDTPDIDADAAALHAGAN